MGPTGTESERDRLPTRREKEEKEERPGGGEGLRGRVHNSTCSRTVERKRERMERIDRKIERRKRNRRGKEG